MQFKDIFGINTLKNNLLTAVKSRQIPHAQLFIGNTGSSNLALALAYAQYIFCESPTDDDSCGTCYACRQTQKLTNPDLLIYFPMANLEKEDKDALKSIHTAAFRKLMSENIYSDIKDWSQELNSENKQFYISVEEGRSILQAVSLKSFQSKHKIVLIWLPEYMHASCANAILKVLEEPPKDTIFLMVSHQPDKLLTTIISRCQMIQVPLFSDEEVCQYIVSKYDTEPKIAVQISKIAQGNLNRAIKLTQDDKDDMFEVFAKWMRVCFKVRNTAEILQVVEELAKKGRENQKNIILYGLDVVRNAFLVNTGNTNLYSDTESNTQFVQKFAPYIHAGNIEDITDELNKAYLHIERNGNAKIVLFDTSLRIGILLQVKQ
ncbi:MAG: DNA polymerase III subunit delta [Cytophagales bacterium]|nr:DNA polymerase III subunit delta [Cytophagales bacterium]